MLAKIKDLLKRLKDFHTKKIKRFILLKCLLDGIGVGGSALSIFGIFKALGFFSQSGFLLLGLGCTAIFFTLVIACTYLLYKRNRKEHKQIKNNYFSNYVLFEKQVKELFPLPQKIDQQSYNNLLRTLNKNEAFLGLTDKERTRTLALLSFFKKKNLKHQTNNDLNFLIKSSREFFDG